VELEILRSIEEALGNGLRIQNFFDLVVGTRSVTLTLAQTSLLLTVSTARVALSHSVS
jgi:hypothetical protein